MQWLIFVLDIISLFYKVFIGIVTEQDYDDCHEEKLCPNEPFLDFFRYIGVPGGIHDD